MGWSEVKKGSAAGSLQVLDQDPFHTANPHYLRLKVENAGDGYGVSNDRLRWHRRSQGRRVPVLRLRPGR